MLLFSVCQRQQKSANDIQPTLLTSLLFCDKLSIDLNSNSLSGKIAEFSSVLQTVDLSHNTLAGDISNLFCAQTDLRYLGLANNTFTGSLPSCISKMRNIQQLLLNNNKLTSIPEIARPQSLYSNNCLLQNNNFECPIPQWTQDYCKATCSL